MSRPKALAGREGKKGDCGRRQIPYGRNRCAQLFQTGICREICPVTICLSAIFLFTNSFHINYHPCGKRKRKSDHAWSSLRPSIIGSLSLLLLTDRSTVRSILACSVLAIVRAATSSSTSSSSAGGASSATSRRAAAASALINPKQMLTGCWVESETPLTCRSGHSHFLVKRVSSK